MSMFKKDTVPALQVEQAWKRGQEVLADNPFGLEILRAGLEASEALFHATGNRGLDGAVHGGLTQDRQEIESRLHTVFTNAVTRFRLLAFDHTHDETGRTTDPDAWEVCKRITDLFLPDGARSRIAKSGMLLIKQCRYFCFGASMALPDGDKLVAPVKALLVEYEAGLDKVDAVKEDQSVSMAELERLRKELLRLRRAGYYLMKCMEAWDPDFPLDPDQIYASRHYPAVRRRAGKKTEASAKPPEGSDPPENGAGSPDEHPVSLEELEALHDELHLGQPDEGEDS